MASGSSAMDMLPTNKNKSSFLSFVHAFTARPLLRWASVLFVVSCLLWLLAPFPIAPPLDYGFDSSYQHPHTSEPIHPPSHNVPTIWSDRAARVRDAFIHAYTGYQRYAAPADELLPVSGGRVNNFNGWGVTTVDALDTMWIMGLNNMFQESVATIAKATFAQDPLAYAPFFETVIRYLGGLLSAYALSDDPILLSRADDLGRMLLPAFNTTSGLPMFAVNTVSGATRDGWHGSALWSEAYSNQMEYKYLAHLTGRAEYFHKTDSLLNLLHNSPHKTGLFSTIWDLKTGTPKNTQFSVGAYADSGYEYFLKQWLLSGQSEPRTRDLYLQSVNGIINNLMFLTPKRKLLYVTDVTAGVPSHKFEHLSCFLPGLFALGVHTLDLPPADKELHLWAAQGLAYTCWMTYADQTTGLGMDEMIMTSFTTPSEGKWVTHLKAWEDAGRPDGVPPGLKEVPTEVVPNREYLRYKPAYLLRPETVESFYILWRTTGDTQWRERGWSVFEAIEKHSRTKYGYACIYDVDRVPPRLKDEMPSYFLAETLKYLFLLFTDEDILPLDKWVFNTEAHPFPVFEWRTWEKEEYHISA